MVPRFDAFRRRSCGTVITRGGDVVDKGYLLLFNAITDLIEQLQDLQRKAEELYIEAEDQ